MSSLELDYLAAKVLLQQTLDAVHKIIIVMDKTDPALTPRFELVCNAAGCLQEGQYLLNKASLEDKDDD